MQGETQTHATSQGLQRTKAKHQNEKPGSFSDFPKLFFKRPLFFFDSDYPKFSKQGVFLY